MIVSACVCATIPWTKLAGYCLSLLCFIELFIIATFQDDFSLDRTNSDDIKVSLSILLTFFVGLFGYFVTVACFCCQRNFKRQVYQGNYGNPDVNMYMPNRTFCEFFLLKKTERTIRLETNLIRQFKGLPLILSPGQQRKKWRLPVGAKEVIMSKAYPKNPYITVLD